MNPSIGRGSKQCNCMEVSMDFPLLGLLVTTEQIETNMLHRHTMFYLPFWQSIATVWICSTKNQTVDRISYRK